MKLENFELRYPGGTVEVLANGHDRDLHDRVDLAGLTCDPRKQELVLRRIALAEYPDPWGSPGNTASACKLRFGGVRLLIITGVRGPSPEGGTLSEIARVTPEPGEFRENPAWHPGDESHLLFSFEDKSSIEIDAAWGRLEDEHPAPGA